METQDKKISKRKQAFIQKRKELIELSKAVRHLVEQGEYSRINEALVGQYKENNPNIETFNTFNQWKELNCTIIKGSKAYMVWGQPRVTAQTPEGSEEPEEYKYWPVCFLFSNEQVINPDDVPTNYKEEPEPINEVIPL